MDVRFPIVESQGVSSVELLTTNPPQVSGEVDIRLGDAIPSLIATGGGSQMAAQTKSKVSSKYVAERLGGRR